MADADNISVPVSPPLPSARGIAAPPVLSLACAPERKTLRGAETSRAHLLFDIETLPRPVPSRLPLNLCLLLDRSGSMDGNALEAAKAACRDVIDKLGPDDFLSVVAFGDEADVVCPARHAASPALLKDYIDRVRAGGRANLSEGLATACGQVASVKGAGTLNRVLLLSDGEPSVGPRDPASLAAQAGDQKARGITISTVGLGPDYPEDLLSGIARRTGGNFYGIAQPELLGDAFMQEMDTLARVVARSLRLRLSLPRGAGVRQVYGQQPVFGQRTVEAILPDPEGGTRLRSLWELEWTARPPAPYRVAVAELLWDDVGTGSTERVTADVVLDFGGTAGAADPNVETEIQRVRTVQALEEAAQAWRTGEGGGAEAVRAEMERLREQTEAAGTQAEAHQAAQSLADLDAGLSPGEGSGNPRLYAGTGTTQHGRPIVKNYYAILEVPVGSSIPEMRAAYRRLVQENLWNREAFAQLKEAYEVLTTPARRSEYDREQFGETFPADAGAGAAASSESGSAARPLRACPMGAASQCPVLNARVPMAETFCPECGVLLLAMPDADQASFATGRPEARLEDTAGQVFALHPGVNIVGREGADILLVDKTVSRRHAQIVLAGDGRSATVEDLGSTNGTRLAGSFDPLLPGDARPVSGGIVLYFGSVEVRLHLPAPVPAPPTVSPGAAPASPARAQFIAARGPQGDALPLVEGVTTFGRRAENSVVLAGDPYVSGSHAQVIADGDLFRLSDLGSTNGTRVNGAALAPNAPHLLSEGDEVVIGSMVYRFERLDPPEDASDSSEIQS